MRHNKSNLYSAIAHLDTIDGAVKSQLSRYPFRGTTEENIDLLLANVRLTGVMQKSSEIAQSISSLMKVEQMQGISQQFSQELMRVIDPYILIHLSLNLDGYYG